MSLSQTRPKLTKLKQTKQHNTNLTEIQASPSHQHPFVSMSRPVHIRTPQVQIQTHKIDQTKVDINGFGMAKRAAQLLYGPVLVMLPLGMFSQLALKV